MHGTHLINHIHHPKLRNHNTLHVIGVCSNPVRFHSRNRLARQFIREMLQTENVALTVVEAAYKDRSHEIVSEIYPKHLDAVPVYTHSSAWIKESMGNLGFRHVVAMHPGAKYFAFIDMDVTFSNPNWAQETMHQLQHFEVVQPWSDALDMGPSGGVLQHCRSFGYQVQNGAPISPQAKKEGDQYYQYAHPGYAWAYTRKFIERMWGAGGSNGPLMDWAILGSADYHMAWSMRGIVVDTVPKKYQPSYLRKCLEWQQKAFPVTQGQVGYVTGKLEHHFHGPKVRRQYNSRYQLLVNNKFDPDKMLIHDEQGIVVLVGAPALEHAIHRYNLSRFEDSIEEK